MPIFGVAPDTLFELRKTVFGPPPKSSLEVSHRLIDITSTWCSMQVLGQAIGFAWCVSLDVDVATNLFAGVSKLCRAKFEPRHLQLEGPRLFRLQAFLLVQIESLRDHQPGLLLLVNRVFPPPAVRLCVGKAVVGHRPWFRNCLGWTCLRGIEPTDRKTSPSN